MFKYRLFNILAIMALVVVAALTTQQALETTKVVHAAEIHGQPNHSMDTSFCPLPIVDRSSLHLVYVKQMGIWVPHTKAGPTGVDGGLKLLSDYRACSQ